MARISLIEPWPATKETAASRMLWLADGYAEGAMVLCNAMAEDDYYPQYTNTRVILHLCRHATELFFKGAIAVKTNQIFKSHRLDKLYAQYLALYPLDKYQISLPFPRAVFNPNEGLFPELLDQYTRTHDQRFRYPLDNEGTPFFDAEPFDVLAYQTAIATFRHELNTMVATLAFGWKR
jgi:hypothetical protein